MSSKRKKAKTTKVKKRNAGTRKGAKKWNLKLYIAGRTGRSEAALRNLEALCNEHLFNVYELEVIDLLKQPQLAKGDQIFAIPTLIKRVPKPVRKIIGDLSNTEMVLVGLDIKPLGKLRK